MLTWDGSYLGDYPRSIIIQKWYISGVLYYGLIINDDFVYVMVHRVKDKFPLIVNDLKTIFELPRRDLHYITISGSIYILYPVPLTEDGSLIWEVPLNQVPEDNNLRNDPDFEDKVRKLFVFCDLMSLPDSDEKNIIIQANQIPINNNEIRTTIMKEILYDFNILPASIIKRWFPEDIYIEHIVADMLNYEPSKSPDEFEILMFNLRSRIDTIIRKYDKNYIWFTNFLLDRISRQIINL